MEPATIEKLSDKGLGFAIFPEVRIYDKYKGKKKSIEHLIFGDVITPPKLANGKGYRKWGVELTAIENGITWIQVRSRQVEGWIRLDEIQMNRTLEVNFVDIGQGDGCHLVTPDDEHWIIDAGQSDNMYRFLRWRFNLSKAGAALPRFTAMISHPDQDHWKGFEWLLSKPEPGQPRRIEFHTLYHNGIIQRANSNIGKTTKVGDTKYLSDFLTTHQQVVKVLNKPGDKSNFEKFLQGSLKNFPDLKFKTVYKGLAPSDVIYNKGVELKVVAPVPEEIAGKPHLRWFDDKESDIAKTKNGHSIVLMARVGRMKILLGGDLNTKSADYLMQHYSGVDIRQLRLQTDAETSPRKKANLKKIMTQAIESCQTIFRAEIAKSCHHGSHDITDEFLQSVNPIATVISSGDEESHFHPRPETLGAIGKAGRGERPLIFSTEIGRSSPEYIDLTKYEKASDKKKQRIVTRYGMVTVRTDGDNAVICQKLERVRYSFGEITTWHVDKIIWNDERKSFISMKELREPAKKATD